MSTNAGYVCVPRITVKNFQWMDQPKIKETKVNNANLKGSVMTKCVHMYDKSTTVIFNVMWNHFTQSCIRHPAERTSPLRRSRKFRSNLKGFIQNYSRILTSRVRETSRLDAVREMYRKSLRSPSHAHNQISLPPEIVREILSFLPISECVMLSIRSGKTIVTIPSTSYLYFTGTFQDCIEHIHIGLDKKWPWRPHDDGSFLVKRVANEFGKKNDTVTYTFINTSYGLNFNEGSATRDELCYYRELRARRDALKKRRNHDAYHIQRSRKYKKR